MATLDSVEIEGFKSIRSAKIELGPINVLIGANGAGKSNLLGVFGLLADLADGRLQLHIGRQGGADAILHFGQARTPELRLTLRFGQYGYFASLLPSANDSLIFNFDHALRWNDKSDGPAAAIEMGNVGGRESGLAANNSAESQMPISSSVLVHVKSWRRFHFHDTGPSAPTKRKHKVDDNRSLRPEADNLTPFLLGLSIRAPGAYRRIVEVVRRVAPFFDDFVLEPDAINPSVILLAWRHKTDDALFTADSLSDGTLRFICLATLLLQPELPSLIVIDEPELGLHPFAITLLVSMIRAASTKTQVLLATQSVTLLDQFQADEVIVVENTKSESTFRRLNDADLTEWREQYSLGELWLKNVLGGRPH